jgi:hypothetical protein
MSLNRLGAGSLLFIVVSKKPGSARCRKTFLLAGGIAAWRQAKSQIDHPVTFSARRLLP